MNCLICSKSKLRSHLLPLQLLVLVLSFDSNLNFHTIRLGIHPRKWSCCFYQCSTRLINPSKFAHQNMPWRESLNSNHRQLNFWWWVLNMVSLLKAWSNCPRFFRHSRNIWSDKCEILLGCRFWWFGHGQWCELNGILTRFFTGYSTIKTSEDRQELIALFKESRASIFSSINKMRFES